ncbi:MAG: IMPACT family protein [Fusobacteriaceae bacterium]
MKTIKKEAIIEFEEKKSKFIGYARPVQTKVEAENYIKEIKQKNKEASHNCSVYKVFDGRQEFFKADDDGEPSGTAGRPMGEIMNYMEVSNLVVIATRYFGGIKLGAGGLVRNYAKVARLAIQTAGTIEFFKTKKILLDFHYEKNSEIDLFLMEKKIEILEKNFGERITYIILINLAQEEKLKNNFKDIIILES